MTDVKCGKPGFQSPKCKVSDFDSCADLGANVELRQLEYKYKDLDALPPNEYKSNHRVSVKLINKKADERFWQTNPFAAGICKLTNKKNPKKTDFYTYKLIKNGKPKGKTSASHTAKKKEGAPDGILEKAEHYVGKVEEYYNKKIKQFEKSEKDAEAVVNHFWQEMAAGAAVLTLSILGLRKAFKKKKPKKAKVKPQPEAAPIDLVNGRMVEPGTKRVPQEVMDVAQSLAPAKAPASAPSQPPAQGASPAPVDTLPNMKPLPDGVEAASRESSPSGKQEPHQTIWPEPIPDMKETVQQPSNGLPPQGRTTVVMDGESEDFDESRTDREPSVDILILLKKFDPPIKSMKKDSGLHTIEERYGKEIPESIVKRAMVLVISEFNPKISTPQEVLELVLETAARKSKNGKVTVVDVKSTVLDLLILKDLSGGEGGMLELVEEVQGLEAETGKDIPMEVVWKAKLLVREHFHPQGMSEMDAVTALLRESSEQCKLHVVTKGHLIDAAAVLLGNEGNTAPAQAAMDRLEAEQAGKNVAFNQRIERDLGGYANWTMRDGYEPAQGSKGPAVDARVSSREAISVDPISDQFDRASRGHNRVTIVMGNTPRPINVHDLVGELNPFKTLRYFEQARELIGAYVKENDHFAFEWFETEGMLRTIKISFTTVLGEVEEAVARTFLNDRDGVTEEGYEASTKKAIDIKEGRSKPFYIHGLDVGLPEAGETVFPEADGELLPGGFTEDLVRVMVQKAIDADSEVKSVLNGYDKSELKECTIWAMKNEPFFAEQFIRDGKISSAGLELAAEVGKGRTSFSGDVVAEAGRPKEKPKDVAKAKSSEKTVMIDPAKPESKEGVDFSKMFGPEEVVEFDPLKAAMKPKKGI